MDGTRTDGVYGDGCVPQLNRQILGKADYGSFFSVVSGKVGFTHSSHIYDSAGASFHHGVNDGPTAVECPQKMDSDGPVPPVEVVVPKLTHGTDVPGVDLRSQQGPR